MVIDRKSAPDSPLLRDGGSPAPGTARSLLMTILGELVWPTGRPVRTAALVTLLDRLGVEEQTARQAIARAASTDWITGERQGREVSWSLTPKLVHIFESRSPRVFSLSNPYTDWDGRWLTLQVTIPHTNRGARRPLYAGLEWAGLGNPTPGLWLSPHVERAAEVGDLIDRLGLRPHTVSFVGTVNANGLRTDEIVEQGWDQAGLPAHYEQILDMISKLSPADDEETLTAHLRLISAWQELPRTDPQLPEALLPDWIGRRAARRIEALRAQWASVAKERFALVDAGSGAPTRNRVEASA